MGPLSPSQPFQFSIPNDQPDRDIILFTFTRDSMLNTTITGPDIIYQVATPKGVFKLDISITRMNRCTEEKRFAGEIIYKAGSRTLVRVGWPGIGWMPAFEWLRNDKPGWSTAMSFTAAYGMKYRWKLRNNCFNLTVDEDPTSPEDSQPSLACFHPSCHSLRLKQTRPAYLEVSPKVLYSLDYIIVSLLVMEKRRRH